MSGAVGLNSLATLPKLPEVSGKQSSMKNKEPSVQNQSPKNDFDQELKSKTREQVEVKAEAKSSEEGKISLELKSAAHEKSDPKVNTILSTGESADISAMSSSEGENLLSLDNDTSGQQVLDMQETNVNWNKSLKPNAEQKPMLKFLDSMEGELGIEPERILAAFGMMPNDVLALPVTETTENFVSNLDLSVDQEPRARSLYQQLLSELSPKADETMSLAKETKIPEGGISLDKQWEFLPKQEQTPLDIKKQKLMERSAMLDALSNKFFNVYPKESVAEVEVASQPMMAGIQAEAVQVQPRNHLSVEKLDSMSEATQNVELPSWISNTKMDTSLENNDESMFQQEEQGLSATDFIGEDVDSENAENESVEEQTESLDRQLHTSLKVNDKSQIKQSALPTNMNQIQVDGDSVAIDEIVQKADVLVKQGGGEMKIQMNNQELGDVHLKVAVNEGKVDLQLSAENHSAKKVLESELQGLKVAMAENQLDLREVKVDVSQDLGSQLQDQLADRQRENARQFLDFFRENHGSGRNIAQYTRGNSSYNQNQSPEQVLQKARNYRNQSDGSRRLSVVA